MDTPHVTLDLSHTAASGSDALAMAAELGGRLAHVHMADGTGVTNRDEHLVPGRGAQPCAPLLEKLAADGYSGVVVLEVNTRRAVSREARLADLTESVLEFTRAHREGGGRGHPGPGAGPARSGPGPIRLACAHGCPAAGDPAAGTGRWPAPLVTAPGAPGARAPVAREVGPGLGPVPGSGLRGLALPGRNPGRASGRAAAGPWTAVPEGGILRVMTQPHPPARHPARPPPRPPGPGR